MGHGPAGHPESVMPRVHPLTLEPFWRQPLATEYHAVALSRTHCPWLPSAALGCPLHRSPEAHAMLMHLPSTYMVHAMHSSMHGLCACACVCRYHVAEWDNRAASALGPPPSRRLERLTHEAKVREQGLLGFRGCGCMSGGDGQDGAPVEYARAGACVTDDPGPSATATATVPNPGPDPTPTRLC